MRTTVRLDDHLLAELKERAARRGTTLSRVIEDLVRQALSQPDTAGDKTQPTRLTTVGGRGPRPGVDLDNTAALLDRMDEDDGAP